MTSSFIDVNNVSGTGNMDLNNLREKARQFQQGMNKAGADDKRPKHLGDALGAFMIARANEASQHWPALNDEPRPEMA